MSYPDADWRLPPFVLVDFDQPRHALNHRTVKPSGDDAFNALVVFHVALKNCVQHVVRRQAVLVGLVSLQLRARRPSDDALRNRRGTRAVRVVRVAPVRQPEDRGFGQVLDHGKAACHVAIQRAIAGGHFALVAGGQHDRAKLIGQRHQQRAANPRLNVLFGRVLCPAFEVMG